MIQATLPSPAPNAPNTATSSSGSEQPSFSPHLDKAIAARNTAAKKEQDDTGKPPAAITASRQESTNGQAGAVQVSPTVPDVPAEMSTGISLQVNEETSPALIFGDHLENQEIEINEHTALPSAEAIPSGAVTIQNSPGAATLFRFTAPEEGGRSNLILITPPQHSPQGKGADNGPLPEEARPFREPFVATAPSHRDSLLARLQQIIENSSESGQVTVSISQIAADTSEKFSRTSLGQSLGLGVAVLDPGTATADKPGQHLTSLRLNVHQQYYEARFGQQQQQSGDPGEQQQNGEAARQAAAGLSTVTPTTTGTDQGGPFNQLLVGGQEMQPLQSTGEQARVMPLPTGTFDHDQEVMRQVMERFHLARGPLDTRINIRLHPAELGALKIDLTVHDGTIRANVVAQSQQVQEIIERNLARLKSLLEDQGFTVDKLVVSAESETATDFNFFDSRSFHHQAAESLPGKPPSRVEATAGFEQLVSAEIERNGVNVKI